jgi:hypothetical protein
MADDRVGHRCCMHDMFSAAVIVTYRKRYSDHGLT